MYIHILIFSVFNGSYVVNYICIIMLDIYICIHAHAFNETYHAYIAMYLTNLLYQCYTVHMREGGEEREREEGREEGREGASERHKLWHKTVYVGVCK